MTQSKKLNLFISYSHLDESQINEFIKHSATFSNNGLIELWYDRNILAGKEFQDKIDINLEQADIVCLFLSANFLASNACMKEKKMALELRKTKGISVISIVLSPCLWLHDKEISPLLALPTDGKEVTDFQDANKAWVNVWNGLKKVIDSEIKVKQLKITEQFSIFLQDTELLNKAHSQKEKIVLDDIFVFPDLEKYDDLRNFEKKENSQKIIEDIYNYPKLLIAGENQSGKTTLCKKIYLELRKLNFVPVYIYDKFNPYLR